MAEFDEAAVLAWLATVPGLTPAQRVAAHGKMAEDEYEYDSPLLVSAAAKTLWRLLKGMEAEGAVLLLLAAREAHLAAGAAAPPPPFSEKKRQVGPRSWPTSAFCSCISKGRKRLLCPMCRMECAVKGGRAAELPTHWGRRGDTRGVATSSAGSA
jgi:hypothetical protein